MSLRRKRGISNLKFLGIGKAFAEQYLARANHTVVATVRDTSSASAKALFALPKATGSKLVLVKIEATSVPDALGAVKELQARGINHLDIVIANAAVAGQQGAMGTIDPNTLADVYMVNAVGPAILFLALKPLLDNATAPKWMSMSTGLATLQELEKYAMFAGFPYGASKVALNYFTKSIHVENPNIIAFAISPG
jgi:NAD(P)-dependent dehydrogenase (short-subunit alcohol dehydrogenase family)